MPGGKILAKYVDYEDGNLIEDEADLHDVYAKALKANASRMIFIDLDNKDHYASCDQCQQYLKVHWAWPEYLFTSACHESNGYVRETVLGTGDDEKIMKQIWLEKNENNKIGIEYEWYEMTISLQHQKNGSISIVCFGGPADFHTNFTDSLQKFAKDKQWRTDSERISAVLMQEVVKLYDASVWAIAKAVRKVEKSRHRSDSEFEFATMHEVMRHAIHTTEILEVAVDSLKELSRVRLNSHLAAATPVSSSGMSDSAYANGHFDFWCRLLQNYQRRSRSNEARLQNEINLALNLEAQKDARATIDLSHAAQKDSAAMRTIAVVTLVFLPATFVATFFGMSFFNYDQKSGWSMTHEVWIFWVVAGVLTLATLLIYFLVQFWVQKPEYSKWKAKLKARADTPDPPNSRTATSKSY